MKAVLGLNALVRSAWTACIVRMTHRRLRNGLRSFLNESGPVLVYTNRDDRHFSERSPDWTEITMP